MVCMMKSFFSFRLTPPKCSSAALRRVRGVMLSRSAPVKYSLMKPLSSSSEGMPAAAPATVSFPLSILGIVCVRLGRTALPLR